MSTFRALVERGPKGAEILDVTDRARARKRTKQRVSDLLSRGADIWLEIGSGRKYGTDGWVTMDVELECDLHADLRGGIPFPDSTVSRIYSSHLFEHLTYPDGQRLMMEARRVLTEGGEFSICVPNARLYIDAYTSGKKLTSPFLGWTDALHGESAIDMVNYIAYMDGHHRYMFDEESLLARLREAGFTDVRLRDFDPSVDSPGRDFESIYAVGSK